MASRRETQPAAWLMFILTLQGQQAAARMRVWRALKALGAAVMRDGVYLLPNRVEFAQALEAQCEEVSALAGSGQILEVEARDQRQEAEFRQLFDRTPEYQQLMQELGKLRQELARLDGSALAARLARLRREYDTIQALDFFSGAASDQARQALEDLVVAANAVLSPNEPHAAGGRIQRLDVRKYRNRTWATRARPWADRLASAWLIRRCIDPRPKFIWLKHPQDCPKRAVGFDFDGAEFTHVGAKVTFEVLLASFGLTQDSALERIGALIHYLDVGGVPVAEAAGLEALLRGARATLDDDDALAAEAARLFDLLYSCYAAGK